jgi:hypothetical protein
MRFFVVIIVVVSACRAFAATPGIYYCVTDYMAGVQRDSEKPNNPPFVGIITPDAPRQKFVVKVVHWDSLPPERRKSEQDELRNFALTKCSYLAEIPGVFPSQRLVSPGLPAAPPLRGALCMSEGGTCFTGNFGESFWFRVDGRFQAAFSKADSSYAFQGRCTAF